MANHVSVYLISLSFIGNDCHEHLAKPLPYRHDPALEEPYVPVPEHLRIKMPMPDPNYRVDPPPDECGACG